MIRDWDPPLSPPSPFFTTLLIVTRSECIFVDFLHLAARMFLRYRFQKAPFLAVYKWTQLRLNRIKKVFILTIDHQCFPGSTPRSVLIFTHIMWVQGLFVLSLIQEVFWQVLCFPLFPKNNILNSSFIWKPRAIGLSVIRLIISATKHKTLIEEVC